MVPECNTEKIREVFECFYRLTYLMEHESIYVLAVLHGMLPLPAFARSTPDNSGSRRDFIRQILHQITCESAVGR